MKRLLHTWRQWARRLANETYALYLAYRDPRTPWYAKAFALAIAAYAFSPIDLIPDFIPVLGYLDDLLIVPAGIALAIRMVPKDVMAECRERARSDGGAGRRTFRATALVVIGLWLLVAGVMAWLVVRTLT
jgi:uncharacterized membrane protein YkvA (DUF1232 family)